MWEQTLAKIKIRAILLIVLALWSRIWSGFAVFVFFICCIANYCKFELIQFSKRSHSISCHICCYASIRPNVQIDAYIYCGWLNCRVYLCILITKGKNCFNDVVYLAAIYDKDLNKATAITTRKNLSFNYIAGYRYAFKLKSNGNGKVEKTLTHSIHTHIFHTPICSNHH